MSESAVSLKFDGASSFVSTPYSPPANAPSGKAWWVKFSSFGSYVACLDAGAFGSGSGWGCVCVMSGGLVNVYVTLNNTTVLVAFPPGEWHHIAANVTSNGTGWTLEAYLDGESQGTGATTGFTGAPLYLGSRTGGGGGFAPCELDDVAVWNTTLDPTDIVALANGSKFPQDIPTGLVRCWHLEEGSGMTTADSVIGELATLHGGATWVNDVPPQLGGGGPPPPTIPVINSPGTASGQVGTAFNYQLTATNSPTSFAASGLPSGLGVNTATGLISGTPIALGSSTVSLSATNSSGTGTASLGLTIGTSPPPPPPPPPSGLGRIVYASSSGILFDGSDETAKIQTILDFYGAQGKPWCFVLDGVAMISSLGLWSNTTLEGLAGSGFKRFANPVGITPFVGNKHSVFTVAPTDTNIRVRGIRVDGNGGGHPPLNDSYTTLNASFGFYGVQDLVLEDCHAYDQLNYGLHLGNVQGFRLLGCSATARDGDTGHNNDCVHVQGLCSDGVISDITGACGDDCLAFNADDYFPSDGPISNIVAENLRFHAPSAAALTDPGRFLSADPNHSITNITVRNYRGVSQGAAQYGWWMMPFDEGALGSGYYAGILLEDIDLTIPNGDTLFLHIEGATVNDLTLRGFRVNGAAPAVWIGPGGNIGTLMVDGLSHINAGGRASIELAGGTLARLRASNSNTALLLSGGTVADKKTDGTEDA